MSQFWQFIQAQPKFATAEICEAWGLLGYLAIGVLLFFSGRRRRALGARGMHGVAAYIAPKSIFRHASLRYDLLVLLGNRTFHLFNAVYFGFRIVSPSKFGNVEILTAFSHRGFFLPGNIILNVVWTVWTLFLYDAVRSVSHYAFHKVPALWEFHKLHHDAPVLSPLTKYREHVIEHFTTAVLNGLAVGLSFTAFVRLFGVGSFNVLTLLGLNVLAFSHFAYGHFSHSHMWLSFGKWGKYFTSPAAHLVHHGAERRHRDKNFSNFFAVIDRLLGTLYIPGEEEHFKIGVRTPQGSAFVNRSFSYLYFGVLADSAKAAVRPPPEGKHESYLAGHDHLHCWCGPDCQETKYPYDRDDGAFSPPAEPQTDLKLVS